MNKYLLIAAAIFTIIVAVIFVPRQMQSDTSDIITKTSSPETGEISADCSGKLTPTIAQGPYYTPNTPERHNIASDSSGEKIIVEGYVFNSNCEPISGAWLDFWQADGNGEYDNVGFNLRGHQFTDENGRYHLETVLPAQYSGRTPHIHVKVQASHNSPMLTTQLYFPGESRNSSDSIFNKSLVVDMSGNQASFNFVLE